MRFAVHRDEPAFRQIVERYGGMVMNVTRQVVWNEQDAEDAFQATFLVLARRATGVANFTSLGGWLHRVALRSIEQRNRRREAPLEDLSITDKQRRPGWRQRIQLLKTQ